MRSSAIPCARFSLQAPTLCDHHLLTRGPTRRPDALDRLDKLLAFDHLAKDGVLAVEMRGRDGGDEELRAISTRMLDSASLGLVHGVERKGH